MMTPHAQNLALAKLDGWKPVQKFDAGDYLFVRNGIHCPKHDLPRYTESLDALRPILLKLSKEQQNICLQLVAHCDHHDQCALFNVATAPASKFAEAILRAVGKYT